MIPMPHQRDLAYSIGENLSGQAQAYPHQCNIGLHFKLGLQSPFVFLAMLFLFSSFPALSLHFNFSVLKPTKL